MNSSAASPLKKKPRRLLPRAQGKNKKEVLQICIKFESKATNGEEEYTNQKNHPTANRTRKTGNSSDERQLSGYGPLKSGALEKKGTGGFRPEEKGNRVL